MSLYYCLLAFISKPSIQTPSRKKVREKNEEIEKTKRRRAASPRMPRTCLPLSVRLTGNGYILSGRYKCDSSLMPPFFLFVSAFCFCSSISTLDRAESTATSGLCGSRILYFSRFFESLLTSHNVSLRVTPYLCFSFPVWWRTEAAYFVFICNSLLGALECVALLIACP